jgi:hypothetical protein
LVEVDMSDIPRVEPASEGEPLTPEHLEPREKPRSQSAAREATGRLPENETGEAVPGGAGPLLPGVGVLPDLSPNYVTIAKDEDLPGAALAPKRRLNAEAVAPFKSHLMVVRPAGAGAQAVAPAGAGAQALAALGGAAQSLAPAAAGSQAVGPVGAGIQSVAPLAAGAQFVAPGAFAVQLVTPGAAAIQVVSPGGFGLQIVLPWARATQVRMPGSFGERVSIARRQR